MESIKRKKAPKIPDIKIGAFLDDEERLTNKMLVELKRVWKSNNWKSHENINEGTYVCEVLAPLFNILMDDLPVNTDIGEIWGTW